VDYKEIGCGMWTEFIFQGQGSVGAHVYTVMNYWIKDRTVLEQLGDCYYLR